MSGVDERTDVAPELPRPSGSVLPAARVGATSWRRDDRTLAVTALVFVVLVVVALLDIARGEVPLTLGDVVSSLTGSGNVESDVIVYDLRLPQTAVALLAGAALGLSGALLQTLARNPLATPDVIGVNAGASLGAVLYIVARGNAEGEVGDGLIANAGLPLSAFAGAAVTSLILVALSRRGGFDGQRLVLLGIGVSAALTAGVSWLLVGARLQSAATAQIWLTGSLNNRGWIEALPVLVVLLSLVPVLAVLSPSLSAVQLGPETARGLGVRTDPAQFGLLMMSVLCAAVAVAAVGPLGFVAFLSPQLARRLCRSSRPPLVSAALVGSTLVLAADLISRTLLPTPLAAGVVTSVIGAPYFLYLLVRTNRRTSA